MAGVGKSGVEVAGIKESSTGRSAIAEAGVVVAGVEEPEVPSAGVEEPDVARAGVEQADVAGPGIQPADPGQVVPDQADADVVVAAVGEPDVAQPDVGQAEVAAAGVGESDVADAGQTHRHTGVGEADVAGADVAEPEVAVTDVAEAQVLQTDVGRTHVPGSDIAQPGVQVAQVGEPEVDDRALIAGRPCREQAGQVLTNVADTRKLRRCPQRQRAGVEQTRDLGAEVQQPGVQGARVQYARAGHGRHQNPQSLRFHGQQTRHHARHDTADEEPGLLAEQQFENLRHSRDAQAPYPQARRQTHHHQQDHMCKGEPDGSRAQGPAQFEHAQNMGGAEHRERECHGNDRGGQTATTQCELAIHCVVLGARLLTRQKPAHAHYQDEQVQQHRYKNARFHYNPHPTSGA